MNNKGNIMLNLLFFFMAMVIVIVFIGPIKEFVDMAQQSDNLNCRGYIADGNPGSKYSFNASLNDNQSGNPIACLAIKLYLPYLLIVFLIGGVSKILYDRTGDAFGMTDQQQNYGGY